MMSDASKVKVVAATLGMIGAATLTAKGVSNNPWVQLGASMAVTTVTAMVVGMPPGTLWEEPQVPIGIATTAVGFARAFF